MYSCIPVPYVLMRDTRGALAGHRYPYVPPSCRASQYRFTFIPITGSQWNDLMMLCSMMWVWRVLSAGSMLLYWPKQLAFVFLSYAVF